MKIPFNKPWFTGKEPHHMQMAAIFGQISGNGAYTKKCHEFFIERFGFGKSLLTTSCSDALEMTALLAHIEPGDEVIMPSFTFVSTANAFAIRGAVIRFADTTVDYPNISAQQISELITSKTKAIVVVHYAGAACDMNAINALASKHKITVIEDAAHALGAYYHGRPCGTLADMATFSFHETKNIICGEGGMIALNKKEYFDRAEIIWEKGTNRAAFHRGEVNKYGWVDIGSSFLPSELISSFLYAQLEQFDVIQMERTRVKRDYLRAFDSLNRNGFLTIPKLPDGATENGNMFFAVCRTNEERNQLLKFLTREGIHAVFHYLPLHNSPYFSPLHDGRELPNTIRFSENIIRFPFYSGLETEDIEWIAKTTAKFFAK